MLLTLVGPGRGFEGRFLALLAIDLAGPEHLCKLLYSAGWPPVLSRPRILINVQSIGALIEPHLERKLGHLPAETLAQDKDALRFMFEL